MDQARLFIAIVLSFLVFIGWELFFSDKEKEAPPKEIPGVAAVEDPVKRVASTPDPMTALEEMPVRSEKETARAVTVQSPKYRTTISERGGRIHQFHSGRLSRAGRSRLAA